MYTGQNLLAMEIKKKKSQYDQLPNALFFLNLMEECWCYFLTPSVCFKVMPPSG